MIENQIQFIYLLGIIKMKYSIKKKISKVSGFRMLLYKERIVITGGSGRFGKILKENQSKYKYNFFFPKKNKLNILKLNTIENFLRKIKPEYLIHLAGLSRPMIIHDKDIKQSIDKNIIGTANITKACSEFGIKLIYISTCYVYPGKKGNHEEDSPVKPITDEL